MIARWQESNLREALEERRGVHLTGVRQCGKTTLSEHVAADGMRHVSLDEALMREAAEDDPAGFTSRPDGKTLVIDEIQKVPALLDAIKIRLDHDNTKGQYLLTGSSNLRFAKKINDSLAGRLGSVRLRTLSLGEMQGTCGDFLRRGFAGEFLPEYPDLDKRAVLHLAFQGGYPEVQGLKPKSRRAWFEDYLNDLLVKDIQDVTEIRKLGALRKVADWMFAHTSKFFDVVDLCARAQLSRITIDNYIDALKALYVVDEVAAWSRSDYVKIGKRPKYLAADPGLVANLLGWHEDSVYLDGEANGKLVETWVYHELAVLAERDSGCQITHYRDSEKREIDFLVENEHGAYLGVEVKAGSSVASADFKHLKWFASNLCKTPFTGIVLYSGRHVLRFGHGFYAVPLSALGN